MDNKLIELAFMILEGASLEEIEALIRTMPDEVLLPAFQALNHGYDAQRLVEKEMRLRGLFIDVDDNSRAILMRYADLSNDRLLMSWNSVWYSVRERLDAKADYVRTLFWRYDPTRDWDAYIARRQSGAIVMASCMLHLPHIFSEIRRRGIQDQAYECNLLQFAHPRRDEVYQAILTAEEDIRDLYPQYFE